MKLLVSNPIAINLWECLQLIILNSFSFSSREELVQQRQEKPLSRVKNKNRTLSRRKYRTWNSFERNYAMWKNYLKQRVPDIEKTGSQEEVSWLNWTIYNDSKNV